MSDKSVPQMCWCHRCGSRWRVANDRLSLAKLAYAYNHAQCPVCGERRRMDVYRADGSPGCTPRAFYGRIKK